MVLPPNNKGALIPIKYKNMNLGVIFQKPSQTAWVGGENSKLVFEDRGILTWKEYLNKAENQNGVYVSSMCCVSFSFNEAIEANVNYLLKNNKGNFDYLYNCLSNSEKELFDDFVNKDNEFDLSDRALGKLSGTTNKGNTCERVAETGRKMAVPQKIWDFPNTQRTPVFDNEDFFAPIPDDLVKKYSDVFFKIFTVNYEFISTDLPSLKVALKQAPIQIIVSCCPGWNGTEVKACARDYEHAILLVGIDEQNRYLVRDSFNSNNDKVLAQDYKIGSALKIVVNFNNPMTNALILKKKGQKDIVFAYPVESEAAMSSYLKNAGLSVPLKEDGKLDWSKIKINGEYE